MDPEEPRISGRLRDALVADLVLEDLDSDYWLRARLAEPIDWTYHLGRQLRIDMNRALGMHDTLMVIIPEQGRVDLDGVELDDLIRSWPREAIDKAKKAALDADAAVGGMLSQRQSLAREDRPRSGAYFKPPPRT